jgi:hypothetical protein
MGLGGPAVTTAGIPKVKNSGDDKNNLEDRLGAVLDPRGQTPTVTAATTGPAGEQTWG